MTYHEKTIEETAAGISVDIELGLDSAEINRRLACYGENRLGQAERKSPFRMLAAQFRDFLVLILMASAVISIAMGEYIDGAVILIVITLNAVLGMVQESRTDNALKALKELSSPMAKVVRGGEAESVSSVDVVPGDIVLLEAGDFVPADLRLTETVNLRIDESSLTGESVPVDKDAAATLAADAALGDRINTAYMGSLVTSGRGRGLVCGTGMDTEIGKIAAALEVVPEEATPLQKKLNRLGKFLGFVCLAVCLLILALGLLRGMNLLEIFMISVSLAVAAIPEGLTIVVTVILALGTQRMVKSHAIVKKLSAVEALGSATVICSDKTGTLTLNRMTVVDHYCDKDALRLLMECSVLCNDAHYSDDGIVGDPTEGALLQAAEAYGLDWQTLRRDNRRVGEIAFDSGRKLMSTYDGTDAGAVVMHVKGAPDEVIRRASFVYQGGAVVPLTEVHRDKIMAANKNFAEQAMRVLAAAYKPTDKIITDPEEAERGLIFLGLAAMIDPPRDEVKAAVAICKQAGIRVKMITGDHKITAEAIANSLGIESEMPAVTGAELDAFTNDELRERVKETAVFARVSPEHKVRLVEALKCGGEVVAMTGDGVNDAPALKRADIGVAMGITGTGVAKEAADMILTDDNFASIVKAVEEGRAIYSNIRKVVGYLLSCNIGEILVIFTAMIINLPVPLTPIHLLTINLITDAFPAFALGIEPTESGIMTERPRKPGEPITDRKMLVSIAFQSCALAIGTLCSFLYGLSRFGGAAVTMCYFTLVLGELLRVYAARSESRHIYRMNPFSNPFLNKCVLVSLVFLLATVYLGLLRPIFSTVPLSAEQLVVASALAFLPLIVTEITKHSKKATDI